MDTKLTTPGLEKAGITAAQRQGALSDDALITMFQGGDEQVFRLIVERYKERIRNVISNILHDPDLVDDLSQDVFIKAYEGLNSFRFDSSLYTWLYRITVNRCRDELRRRKIRRFFSLQTMLEANDAEVVRRTSQPASEPWTRELVENALARVPEKFRIALVLRDIDGLHYEEMAEILQCELGTVKSRIARGRAIMRELLLPSVSDLDGIVSRNRPAEAAQ